jgi:hypothetical protein
VVRVKEPWEGIFPRGLAAVGDSVGLTEQGARKVISFRLVCCYDLC